MKRTTIAVTVALALGSVIAAAQLRGGTQPGQPDYTTGPVTITGEVRIGNEPVVQARQDGVWTVSLADQRVAPSTTPEFLQAGATYTFTWPAGASEEHRVVAVGDQGWVRVDTDDGHPKWLNTGTVQGIEASATRQRR